MVNYATTFWGVKRSLFRNRKSGDLRGGGAEPMKTAYAGSRERKNCENGELRVEVFGGEIATFPEPEIQEFARVSIGFDRISIDFIGFRKSCAKPYLASERQSDSGALFPEPEIQEFAWVSMDFYRISIDFIGFPPI